MRRFQRLQGTLLLNTKKSEQRVLSGLGMKGNFIKLKKDQNILINDFDYDSIMIYGNYAFSKKRGVLKTMEAKNGHELLNPYDKTKMTDSDIERVNKLYKCPGFEN
ncbi:hypothetical protein AVEN_3071-1 [Araneus ventricosus]|uniref:Metalloendopeptidase n=1 Tax=Araneus ventricosus TaxID=182803 RepID=A0A4Y2FLL7_ARAVE|nr:hypothetical protein AVEN_3071-1 [Araneus ventricosus]